MKTPDHDAGFYSTPSEDPEQEAGDKHQNTPGEFPEEEEGSNVVYEEVPWLEKKPLFYPGISNAHGNYISVSESLFEDLPKEEEQDNEIDIEEAQKHYWKCSKCNELVEMQYDVCWNCQSDMPLDIVHPDKEEVIKEISENSYPIKTFGLSLVLIIVGIVEIIFGDWRRHSLFNNNERFVFGGILIIAGLGLLWIKFYRHKPELE